MNTLSSGNYSRKPFILMFRSDINYCMSLIQLFHSESPQRRSPSPQLFISGSYTQRGTSRVSHIVMSYRQEKKRARI